MSRHNALQQLEGHKYRLLPPVSTIFDEAETGDYLRKDDIDVLQYVHPRTTVQQDRLSDSLPDRKLGDSSSIGQ